MNIWGIHMGEHVGSAPVEEGYVGIGWPAMGNLADVEPTRIAFKSKLSTTHPNTKDGAIPVQAGVFS